MFGRIFAKTGVLACVAAMSFFGPSTVYAGGHPGEYDSDLPEYTLDQVSHHNDETSAWVIYKEGVYDITDWVAIHPGGSIILEAAGSSIEPFWKLYSHPDSVPNDILEQYRIGNLDAEGRASLGTAKKQLISKNPWKDEPFRPFPLKVNKKKPFNAELPFKFLHKNFFTPNEMFYVRNHHPVPAIDPLGYRLHIRGLGVRDVDLSLNDLKTKFKHVTIPCAIQCAGNRRVEMSKIKQVQGTIWTGGAISNATWTGVKLRDVLMYCGCDPDETDFSSIPNHVHLEGLDWDPMHTTVYGVSIPFSHAISADNDVILAFEMNGETLPPDHGYPLRIIIPGFAGTRSVKWLGKIILTKQESKMKWQVQDYKGMNPSTTWETLDYTTQPPIYELPVQSAITTPASGEEVDLFSGPNNTPVVEVCGYAYCGGGNGIVRVDVSGDGGKNWTTAELDLGPESYRGKRKHRYSWALWKALVPVPDVVTGSRDVELVCKAVDDHYNVQPERTSPIYNLRGVLSNAWHRVNVSVSEDELEIFLEE